MKTITRYQIISFSEDMTDTKFEARTENHYESFDDAADALVEELKYRMDTIIDRPKRLRDASVNAHGMIFQIWRVEYNEHPILVS